MTVSEAFGERELKRAEPNHVPALDGLRGLAILLVLFRHIGFDAASGRAWWMRELAAFAYFGYIGVDLFFVLSGFLITGILYKTLGEKRYFKNFYMRRFLRIFPLYYGYLFLLLVLSRPLHIAWNEMLPVFLSYTQNIFLVKPYTVLWYYTVQLWSLAVEEQFYIVWPLLIFFLRNRKQLMGTALFLCFLSAVCRIFMAAHGVSGGLIYTLTPCRMDSLLIGAWIALAKQGPVRLWIFQFSRSIFLACIVLFIVFSLPSTLTLVKMGYIFPMIGYSVVAVGFASLLVMALDSASVTSKVCQLHVLRWLGKYSYGIYVIHVAVLHAVNGAIGKWHAAADLLSGWHALSGTVSLMSIGLSLCLAWISYNFYEVHFLKLKKYFSYDRQLRQPVIAE